MAISHLVRGESDWDTKINDNFDSLQEDIDQAVEDAEQANNTKVPKPVNPTLSEGFLYQNADGTTRLTDGGLEAGLFHYGVVIDNGADGTPTACEYTDDCVGFIPANGSNLGDWANAPIMDYFKPCVIAPGDGAPKYYLNKNNYTLKENGEASVLTGADGDVMIEVQKLYGKLTKVGTRIKVEIANFELSGGFCFHEIGGTQYDVMYRGAYKAGVVSGAASVMRSVSGVAPLVNITRATGRTYAVNRGTAYHQNNFYMLLLWQMMYLLMYRDRDSQTALGQGRSLSSNTAAANTGSLNTRPFCWGDQGGVNGVKFLGCEDFYGNVWEWVDGAVITSDTYKLTKYPSRYNDTGDGYEYTLASGMTAANNNNKYITQVAGTNEAGFLPTGSGGSSSTYFCDNMWLADGVQVVSFGGSWDYAAAVGAFSWYLADSASASSADLGSRLCRV